MEILGIGILAVCFLIAIMVIDAVRTASRPPVWALPSQTLREAPVQKTELPVVATVPSAPAAARTVQRDVKVPVAA